MEKRKAVAIVSSLNLAGHWVEKASGFFCVCLLGGMTAVVLVGVVFRYALKNPFAWTEEIARFLLLVTVFLSINTAFRQKQHIAVTFVVDRLPTAARTIADYAAHALMAFFLLVLAQKGYAMAQGTLMTASTIDLSMRWLYLFVPLGALLTLIQLLIRVAEKTCKVWGG